MPEPASPSFLLTREAQGRLRQPRLNLAASPCNLTPMSAKTATPQRRPEPDDLDALMERISGGLSLRAACAAMGLHTPSTHTWLEADGARREQYARAKEQRAEHLAEQALTLGIAAATGQTFDGHKVDTAGARVALDAIKWATARMAPKTAPVTRVAHSFEGLSDDELDKRITELGGSPDEPPADA